MDRKLNPVESSKFKLTIRAYLIPHTILITANLDTIHQLLTVVYVTRHKKIAKVNEATIT